MVAKGIRGGICQASHRYAKANGKYMKDYDKNNKSPYRQYWDVNNLYGWKVSQKFSTNDFKWIEDISEFTEDFIERYNDESDKIYFLAVDVQYPENLNNLHNDLLFLPERIKIEKDEKFVANLLDKTEYVIHIRNLKGNNFYYEY